MGKLDPDDFAGGAIKLNSDSAAAALVEVLGKPLNMDAQTAAFGLVEVVDENMANAARVHAVENGQDLADYTMIAFGGAAPLHAARLCEKLDVDRLLVPTGAGVGSAIGFLRAPFSFEANRSVFMSLSKFKPAQITTLLGELEREATKFVRSCEDSADIVCEYKVYMRYSGQGWEIPVSLTEDQAMTPDAATYLRLFETDYSNLFGRTVDGMDVEITVWSVNATTRVDAESEIELIQAQGAADVGMHRTLFEAALGRPVEASVVSRAAMRIGETVAGPGVITEDETTIIVPSSRQAIKQPDGCIDITLKQSA
jgi:N-methylhydantoinase A